VIGMTQTSNDLDGQVFAKLTVRPGWPAFKDGAAVYYLCDCSCEVSTAMATKADLESGQVTQCEYCQCGGEAA
jgi:hypothetical protein